jgi:hypothetical protein
MKPSSAPLLPLLRECGSLTGRLVEIAALDEKQLRVIGLTQPPGAVQEAALGWPEHEEAKIAGPLRACRGRTSPPKLAGIQRDLKIRGYTVVQFPNAPLWVALAALLVARLTDDGSVIHDLARAISYVALTIWAYEEAANGVNGFRKALGIGALVWIVVALAQALD